MSLWSAFRRDRWALTGLILVGIVSLACTLAPWLAPDAATIRPWLGGLPPLARTPALPDTLAVGAAVPWQGTVVLEGLAAEPVRYRCALRHGVLEIRGPDSRLMPGLEVPAGARLLGPSGWQQAAQPGVLAAGNPPPAWLLDTVNPVRYVALPVSGPDAHWTLEVGDGRISAVHGPAGLEPSRVRRILVDGREQTRLHLLGTDLQGRDELGRVLMGGRISLLVGLVATLVSLGIGVVYGAIAGYRGGRIDALMMGGVDVLSALPFLFLVVLLMTLVGNNLYVLFAALGAVQWLTMARIVRAQVLSLAGGDFISAARASGLPPHRILLGHLVPNCLGPVVVFAALTVPAVIMEESFLSFIGLGVLQDGRPLDSWGALVAQGMAALGSHGERAWLLLAPAVLMTSTLLALNLVGDGLRAALDPKLARMAR